MRSRWRGTAPFEVRCWFPSTECESRSGVESPIGFAWSPSRLPSTTAGRCRGVEGGEEVEDGSVVSHADRVLEEVRSRGKRITAERRLLIEIISARPHLDAERLHRLAKRKQPQIGLATVYRTLRMLEECGLVRADELGEGHAHYEIDADEHFHLVCSKCGRIIDMPPPRSLLKRIEAQGFRVDRAQFECFGLCAECQNEADEAGD
jgi:Fe2+ or Zn2+ uptake regulation protein